MDVPEAGFAGQRLALIHPSLVPAQARPLISPVARGTKLTSLYPLLFPLPIFRQTVSPYKSGDVQEPAFELSPGIPFTSYQQFCLRNLLQVAIRREGIVGAIAFTVSSSEPIPVMGAGDKSLGASGSTEKKASDAT